MDLEGADREGNPKYMFRGSRGAQRPETQIVFFLDLFTFASKEHIFFAHRAPWGEIKQSRAQIKALAEICVIGVPFPVRTVEVHNGYMFLAARGKVTSSLHLLDSGHWQIVNTEGQGGNNRCSCSNGI